MREVSLSFRSVINGQNTDDGALCLATITHPDLAGPVRLSSDPTTRTSTDPLQYGTVSNGETYLYALWSAAFPDDQEGSPPRSRLVFDNVAQDQVTLVRSIPPGEPALVTITIGLISNPDHYEVVFSNLSVINADYDANQISLDISREPLSKEPWPCDRQTKARFPGLHR